MIWGHLDRVLWCCWSDVQPQFARWNLSTLAFSKNLLPTLGSLAACLVLILKFENAGHVGPASQPTPTAVAPWTAGFLRNKELEVKTTGLEHVSSRTRIFLMPPPCGVSCETFLMNETSLQAAVIFQHWGWAVQVECLWCWCFGAI
jgi:hypothetical protein